MESYGTLGLIFLGIFIGLLLAAGLIAGVVSKVLDSPIVKNFFAKLVKRVKDDPNWEFKKIKLYGYDVTLKANREGLFLCLGAIKRKIYP